MNNASMIVKSIVSDLMIEAGTKNKHVLKVDTIRERAERHIGTKCEDENHEFLYSVGMTQLIYRWLNSFGYYAVRHGLFVNPKTCHNINYLNAVVNNKENDVEGRQAALSIIREYRDGQLAMEFVKDIWIGNTDPMTEDEFLDYLYADAV